MYQGVAIPGGYNFGPTQVNFPPDLFDITVPNIMFLNGPGPLNALNRASNAIVTMQGNIRSSSVGNHDRPTTKTYWTAVLSEEGRQPSDFDQTCVLDLVRMLNRFAWSPNLIYDFYSLVAVTYVTNPNSTAYATWMSELTSIPDVGQSYGVLLLQDVLKYVHFILGSGTEQQTVARLVYEQSKGGAFMDVLRYVGSNVVLPAIGRLVKNFTSGTPARADVMQSDLCDPPSGVEEVIDDLISCASKNSHMSPVLAPYTFQMSRSSK
jgi:hypothetical protein